MSMPTPTSGFDLQGLAWPSASGEGCIPQPPPAKGKDKADKPTGKRAALKPQGEGVVCKAKGKRGPNGLSADLRAFVEGATAADVAAAYVSVLLHKGPVVVLFAPIADTCC